MRKLRTAMPVSSPRRTARGLAVLCSIVGALIFASSALAGTTVLGTISLGAGTEPTGVVANTTNHIAYVAESGADAVAAISGYTAALPGTATALPSGSSTTADTLPNLDFPDDLAIDSAGYLYASNFCANNTNTASKGLCPTGTPSTDIISQSHAGTYEVDHLTGSASDTAGTLKLSFVLNGVTYTTAAIAFNATNTTVSTAIQNATNGNTTFPATGIVAATGGPLNSATAIVLTFENGAYGPITGQTVTPTGYTGPTPTFTRTTDGTYGSGNTSIASGTCNDGSGIAIAVSTTGSNQNHLIDSCAGTSNNENCGIGDTTPFTLCTGPTSTPMLTTGVTGTQCAPNTPCPATAVPSGLADDTTESTTTHEAVVADAANNTIQMTTDTANSDVVLLASGCIPAGVSVGAVAGTIAPVFVACPGTGTVEKGIITAGSIGAMTATALGHSGSGTGCVGASGSQAPYGVATNELTTGGNWTGSLVVTDSANNVLDVYTLGGVDTAAPTLTGPTCVATGSVPVGVAMGRCVRIRRERSRQQRHRDRPADRSD